MLKKFCDSEVHSDVPLLCVVFFVTAWTVQCAIIQNNLYLFKVINCTALHRKFIFRYIGTPKYAFLQLKRNSWRNISTKCDKNYR